MGFIADLQIHSRYARACSKDISIANLEKYARIKGLDLLGTGDFQHPKWFEEICSNLEEDDKGILWTKTKFPFLWRNYYQNAKIPFASNVFYGRHKSEQKNPRKFFR